MEAPVDAAAYDLAAEALELTPADWDEFLENACASDQKLRRQVESILSEAQDGASSFSASAGSTLAASDVIGDRFKLIRQIGEGGMGRVYEAIDLEGHATVAIKIIRPDIPVHLQARPA